MKFSNKFWIINRVLILLFFAFEYHLCPEFYHCVLLCLFSVCQVFSLQFIPKWIRKWFVSYTAHTQTCSFNGRSMWTLVSRLCIGFFFSIHSEHVHLLRTSWTILYFPWHCPMHVFLGLPFCLVLSTFAT